MAASYSKFYTGVVNLTKMIFEIHFVTIYSLSNYRKKKVI